MSEFDVGEADFEVFDLGSTTTTIGMHEYTMGTIVWHSDLIEAWQFSSMKIHYNTIHSDVHPVMRNNICLSSNCNFGEAEFVLNEKIPYTVTSALFELDSEDDTAEDGESTAAEDDDSTIPDLVPGDINYYRWACCLCNIAKSTTRG